MIVDDEPLAREGLMLHLNATGCIRVISACASANDAKLALEHYAPDVIFLDIEMPGLSGIDFAQWLQINAQNPPKIVFVTAFQEFAIKAFEFEAFDYLLKPFAEERFSACIDKLKVAFSESAVVEEHKKLGELLVRKTGNSLNTFIQDLAISEPGKLKEMEQTISLKSGTHWLRVQLSSINWIEAAGDYMCVHTQDGTHIIRKTLKQFEDDLTHKQFVRVNRSAIINLTKMKKLTPNSNGEYFALLTCGDTVKVTRNYKLQLDELQ